MLQQMIRVGSIFLIASIYISAMQGPTLKQLATKKVAELTALNPGYCVKAFNTLPRDISIAALQQLMSTNTYKNALPAILLGYKHYQQQQQDNKHYQLRLACSSDKQIQLTAEQSKELMQASATIQNLIQDIDNGELSQEIPLSLLTQEQITALLSYAPIINALNTSTSTLPMLQQEMPETAALSHYWIKHTAVQQLKEHLATQTIPMLCDLIIAASYLDIYNDEQTVNFIELATQALANKLLQLPQYQDDYDIINTLPSNIQNMLVRYLIDNSTVRYTLCGNSTNVNINTAQTLTGHIDYVNAVSWSPDCKHIASGANDNTVRIWDTQSSTCIHILTDHTDRINSVSWSSNGKQIASSSNDETIKIWDTTTGTCMHTLTDHISYITSVSWSPNDNQLASGSGDCTIRVWDTTTGTCINILRGHSSFVNSVSWSSDGKHIASSSCDKTVKIWDAQSGTCTHTLTGHTNYIDSISWSPDGNHIASGSLDKTIKIWNINNSTCTHTLKGHTDYVKSVSWSHDSKYIVSSSDDNTIRVWDTSTGTCMYTLPGNTHWVNSVSWSPDGKYIASGSNDDTVKLWHIIDKNLDNYLKTTISWEQALLLVRIVNQQDIDFTKDKRALHCYNGLPEEMKQRIKVLLSGKTQATAYTIKNFLETFRTLRSLWYWLRNW